MSQNGEEVARTPLEFTGETSQFRGTLRAAGPGAHDILVYAYHPATGNTGVDRTSVIVE